MELHHHAAALEIPSDNTDQVKKVLEIRHLSETLPACLCVLQTLWLRGPCSGGRSSTMGGREGLLRAEPIHRSKAARCEEAEQDITC